MMSNITTTKTAALSPWQDNQLALIKRTVAPDCNSDEFNQFISMAMRLDLDPLRRQIYAFVFGKGNKDRRKMSIVIGIDGFRTIAAKSGEYLPSDREPEFTFHDDLKGPANPTGLEKAVVYVQKFGRDGQYHHLPGIAYWSEFAPIREKWEYDKEAGKRRPTGVFELDTSGQWGKMPRHMLAKCAEAQALRKGWPDELSNVYDDAEIDKERIIDITPSEVAEEAERDDRRERVGMKGAIMIDWLDGKGIVPVHVSELTGKAMDFLNENSSEPGTVAAWSDSNRYALREFWAEMPDNALEIKKRIEEITGQ